MIKKWLYSVAVGALLIAGEALGITVHDVLSNGFWSVEHRGTSDYIKDETSGYWHGKLKKEKQTEDGKSSIYVNSCRWSPMGIRFKDKIWYNGVWDEVNLTSTTKERFLVKRPTCREKTEMNRNWKTNYQDDSRPTNVEEYLVYTAQSRKKDARPMGPLVVDDWFPDSIAGRTWWGKGQFYGTKETAVTNIVSDYEAYITRTISQSGFIDKYKEYPVNQCASLLRTYNTHITTDDDHVYVEQTICENSTNNPTSNQQDAYQTQYVATFKKGRWKSATETITRVREEQYADWYVKYLKQDQEQTTQVSSHQPDHWTMNQRQNSR